MTDAWITTMSTNLEAVVNPLSAACDRGYVPDELYVLENPGVADQIDDIIGMMEVVVKEYAETDPDVYTTRIDHETEFEAIVEHVREPVERIRSGDGTVAVDVTPGRKFMSALAFQAGIRFNADHVFYLYIRDAQFYGRIYQNVPRPSLELIDFSEVFE